MSPWIDVIVVLLALVGGAVFSGSETAFYRLSRVRLDMEARQGVTSARLVTRLLRDETALVIVLVLGVNLCLEVMTHRVEALLEPYDASRLQIELVLGLVLTPTVLFFAELLPKEIFRRRPHGILAIVAPFLTVFRWIVWPLERCLWLLTTAVSRIFRLEARLFGAAQGREAVLGFLQEGRKAGAIPAHAEALARNVLKLRSIPVERCMVPWTSTERLDASRPNDELYSAVSRSTHTRLLVVDAHGVVTGYVHQLDVLGSGPDDLVLAHLRPIVSLPANLPVDRALARLRASGSRLAIVGPLDSPAGLLTLKDLVEEISGDLAGW